MKRVVTLLVVVLCVSACDLSGGGNIELPTPESCEISPAEVTSTPLDLLTFEVRCDGRFEVV